MSQPPNTPQEVVDDLLTDPDKNVERTPSPAPPVPPQTIANEPSRGKTKAS